MLMTIPLSPLTAKEKSELKKIEEERARLEEIARRETEAREKGEQLMEESFLRAKLEFAQVKATIIWRL